MFFGILTKHPPSEYGQILSSLLLFLHSLWGHPSGATKLATVWKTSKWSFLALPRTSHLYPSGTLNVLWHSLLVPPSASALVNLRLLPPSVFLRSRMPWLFSLCLLPHFMYYTQMNIPHSLQSIILHDKNQGPHWTRSKGFKIEITSQSDYWLSIVKLNGTSPTSSVNIPHGFLCISSCCPTIWTVPFNLLQSNLWTSKSEQETPATVWVVSEYVLPTPHPSSLLEFLLWKPRPHYKGTKR